MNSDFHYGYIYSISRLSGLDVNDAKIVAHACQYIDDSTVDGVLEFREGQSYLRIAAAHGMLDHRNSKDTKDRLVWAPFHFLPAGEGESLEDKAICRKNSQIAQEMVREALRHSRHSENSLHRLGVTLHVYIDTWAHQGFSGIISDYNVVRELHSEDHPRGFWEKHLIQHLEHALDAVAPYIIDSLSKVGHGAALHFPDLPWAHWKYRNGHGHEVERHNLPDFLDAANMACKVVQSYISGSDDFTAEEGLDEKSLASIEALMHEFRSENGDDRLESLMLAISEGRIHGLKEQVPSYAAKGEGSWKHAATGITAVHDDGAVKPLWTEKFEGSDYKKFHNAVKEHRFMVMEEILPRHGVRLA